LRINNMEQPEPGPAQAASCSCATPVRSSPCPLGLILARIFAWLCWTPRAGATGPLPAFAGYRPQRCGQRSARRGARASPLRAARPPVPLSQPVQDDHPCAIGVDHLERPARRPRCCHKPISCNHMRLLPRLGPRPAGPFKMITPPAVRPASRRAPCTPCGPRLAPECGRPDRSPRSRATPSGIVGKAQPLGRGWGEGLRHTGHRRERRALIARSPPRSWPALRPERVAPRRWAAAARGGPATPPRPKPRHPIDLRRPPGARGS